MCTCRNEAYQEDMWAKTIGFLKDHLSPDVMEKYGSPQQSPAAIEVKGQEVSGAATEGAGVTSTGETVETGEIVEGGETVKGGETIETGEIAETVENGETIETGETAETVEGGDKQLEEGT